MPQESRAQRRRQSRSGTRRSGSSNVARAPRPAARMPEPINYDADYADAAVDLRRIVLWAGLLIIGMIAISFVI